MLQSFNKGRVCSFSRNVLRTVGLHGELLCIGLVVLFFWLTGDGILVSLGATLDKSVYSTLLQKCLNRILLRLACTFVASVVGMFAVACTGYMLFPTGSALLQILGIIINSSGWSCCLYFLWSHCSALLVEYRALSHDLFAEQEDPWESCLALDMACFFLHKNYLSLSKII